MTGARGPGDVGKFGRAELCRALETVREIAYFNPGSKESQK